LQARQQSAKLHPLSSRFSWPSDGTNGETEDASTVFEPIDVSLDVQSERQDDVERQSSTSKPYAVFRAFSLISLVAIVIAAVLLAMCYRYVSIHSITKQSEVSNTLIAQAALGPLHEKIAEFLVKNSDGAAESFPEDATKSLNDLIKDTRVRKVKVYNSHGGVVFSTIPAEIGRHQMNNSGVIGALSGQVTSRLIYRDAFNRFNGVSEDDNLIQTYLPVQAHHAGAAVGAFEIYTDITPLVVDNEEAQMIIVGTAILIMVLLYVSLLAIVSRIEKIIDLQQDALRERSELLAALSARMLNAQESEKQRIAAELHERVAQTLSAVKLNVETALAATRRGSGNPIAILESMVPALQAATQDVRTVAVGLRPSSLDDLGLLATLRWTCREFSDKHPQVKLEYHLDIEEDQVPVPLRSIVFRVVEDAFAALGVSESVARVGLTLAADASRITLTVRDDALRGDPAEEGHPYAHVRERTVLAGGKFSCYASSWGGQMLKATWLR
jgi:signal transduction histidine kinase